MARLIGEQNRPYFQHFGGSDVACPWHHGAPISEDQQRAAQYDGAQESELHRRLCEQIAYLASLDKRHVCSKVGKYLPSKEGGFGRYPDVYVEWQGVAPFAIEFQLSNTFQTEISDRGTHYEREGIPLIWVLYGVNPKSEHTPQSYRDLIWRHRGNAFILDKAAIDASHKERTLMLSCYLQDDAGAFHPPIQVRVDALTFPRRGLPYYEDQVAAPLVEEIAARRKPWHMALAALNIPWPLTMHKVQEVQNAFALARTKVGRLSSIEPAQEEMFTVLRLVGLVFTVIASAAGKNRNYVTNHDNIKATLNTMLHTSGTRMQPYSGIIEVLLRHTALATLLAGTVGNHIERAKREAGNTLCRREEPEWTLIQHLVPEVFDRFVRERMSYFGVLPTWATSPTTTDPSPVEATH